MNQQLRKTYYNRCKPFESLSPDDEKNLDLDNFGDIKVRGINWVERLAGRIELSDSPVFELFTGLPGSGKSTELKRLAKRLRDKRGAHLLPVLIEAEEFLDLANPLDIPDIIAAIIFQAEAEVLKLEGKDPEQAAAEGYLTRLWNWLSATDIELNKAEYQIPQGPKLVAEMKTRPSLRERVRKTVAAHLSRFLEDARRELELLNERARIQGWEGLVIIVDSLEKLRGISTNWHQVLESAERIFASGAPYLQLPVHVIYTIPTALVSRRFNHVEFMPMIKLRDQQGQEWEPGFDAARELVRMRAPDNVLAEFLGQAQMEPRLHRLIAWSGGYPREIIRLLQSIIAVPRTPLSDQDFERVLNEVGDAYRKVVPEDSFNWLAQVALDHYLTMQNDTHRQAADLMLSNNAVLRYLNGKDWFDLHPAVEQIPGVQEAKQKLETQRAQASTDPAPASHE